MNINKRLILEKRYKFCYLYVNNRKMLNYNDFLLQNVEIQKIYI